MLNRIAIKGQAKKLIRETKPSVILTGLVYVVITSVLSVLMQKLTGLEEAWLRIQQDMYAGVSFTPEYFRSIIPDVSVIAKLLAAIIEIFGLIISAGFVFYCVNVFRKRKSGIYNLFDGFNLFLKIFLTNLLVSIFVFLWSLLLFIPGIIAGYRYRFAIHVLSDNPELSPMQCIRESKRLTKGHKWGLFVLDLSFIGWLIVAGLIGSLFAFLVTYSLPVFNIWLSPYMGITAAGFYAYIRLEKDGIPICDEAPEQPADSEM